MASAEKYNELPEEVRTFLEDLRPEEVVLMQDGIRMIQAIRTVSKFMKWVIIAAVGTFIATVTLWDSVLKVKGWWGK